MTNEDRLHGAGGLLNLIDRRTRTNEEAKRFIFTARRGVACSASIVSVPARRLCWLPWIFLPLIELMSSHHLGDAFNVLSWCRHVIMAQTHTDGRNLQKVHRTLTTGFWILRAVEVTQHVKVSERSDTDAVHEDDRICPRLLLQKLIRGQISRAIPIGEFSAAV